MLAAALFQLAVAEEAPRKIGGSLLDIPEVAVPEVAEPATGSAWDPDAGPDGSLEPHDPIRIRGDGDFERSSAVVGGRGTAQDPYRIAGWSVDGQGTPGILVEGTSSHFVVEDVAVENASQALRLSQVRHATVRDAALTDSHRGLAARDAVHLDVVRVNASDNEDAGAHLAWVRNLDVREVLAADNGDGIRGEDLRRVTIVGSRLDGNAGDGMRLHDAAALDVTRNVLLDNAVGMNLTSVRGGLLYDNALENDDNARSDGDNRWNVSKRPGPNVVGGPYVGGNWWSDYAGEDTDGDGLGDTRTPYQVGDRGDHLPLVPPGNFSTGDDGDDGNGTDDGDGTSDDDSDGNTTDDGSDGNTTDDGDGTLSGGDGNEAPGANFTWSPEEPHAGEEVHFESNSSDPDGNITSWHWDLDDGTNATGPEVNHTYASPGNYSVNLTVEDDAGARDSKVRVVAVSEPSCRVALRFLHADGSPVNLTRPSVNLTVRDVETNATLSADGTGARLAVDAEGHANGTFGEDECSPEDALEVNLTVDHHVETFGTSTDEQGEAKETLVTSLPLDVAVIVHSTGPPIEGGPATPTDPIPFTVDVTWLDGDPAEEAEVSFRTTWPDHRLLRPQTEATTTGTAVNGTHQGHVPFDVHAPGPADGGAYMPGRHQVNIHAQVTVNGTTYHGWTATSFSVVLGW